MPQRPSQLAADSEGTGAVVCVAPIGQSLLGPWTHGLSRICRVATSGALEVALACQACDAVIEYKADPSDYVCTALADSPHHVPLIAMLAVGDAEDRARALDLGFDDALSSTVAAVELVARIRAIRRRFAACSATKPGFLDPRHTTHLGLRRAEKRVLDYLVLHAGRIVPPSELLENVFGGRHTTEESLVRVHVAALRKRLGMDRGLVQTCKGYGYTIDPVHLQTLCLPDD